jgi:hypothetical protein
MTRDPLLDLLAAVVTQSDDALPVFRRWCDEHLDVIAAIASDVDPVPAPASDAISFDEVLVFVRMQLTELDGVRATIGLDEGAELRYRGLREMETDLIARTSG